MPTCGSCLCNFTMNDLTSLACSWRPHSSHFYLPTESSFVSQRSWNELCRGIFDFGKIQHWANVWSEWCLWGSQKWKWSARVVNWRSPRFRHFSHSLLASCRLWLFHGCLFLLQNLMFRIPPPLIDSKPLHQEDTSTQILDRLPWNNHTRKCLSP